MFVIWWKSITGMELDVFKEEILFGFLQNSAYYITVNYCILLAKCYIYRPRLFHKNELSLYQFQCELKQRLRIEKYICYSNNQEQKFKKWNFLLESMQHVPVNVMNVKCIV